MSVMHRSAQRRWRFVRAIVAVLVVALVPLFVARPANAQDGKLAADVLNKVKHATVYLRVKLGNGTDVQGTGWFAERDVIVTNSHVLGLLGAASRLPQRIEAVIDSGEAASKTVNAKFLGADVDADLALLKVEGPDLPEPLSFGATADLGETHDVLIFGFPFGKELGKSITVTKSSVTSLRKENGQLKDIQVNGGMHPGNSGGPVINQRGEVVGVAVRVVTGTTINFAIPVDKVKKLLNGMVTAFATESAVMEGTQIKIPVRITSLDPLKRIKSIQLECWTGRMAKNRLRSWSSTEPAPVEGDSEIKVINVSYEGKPITLVEAPVPPLTDDKMCYWFRTKSVDGGDNILWSTALGNLRPVPIDRRETSIKFQPPTGPAAPMALTNDSTFKVQFRGVNETRSMHVRVIMNPVIQPPEADGDIHSRVKYSTVTLGMKVNGEPVKMKETWTPLGQGMLKTVADFEYDEDGAIVRARAELGKADAELKASMTAISDHLLQSVEVLTISLPNRTIRPLDKVRTQRSLLVGLPGTFVPAEADVKYQFLGVRTATDGRETAVFEVTGNLRPRRGDDQKVEGRITGNVELLVATGEVFSGNTTMTVDMELAEVGNLRLFGSLVSDFRRAPPKTQTPEETPPVAAKGNFGGKKPDVETKPDDVKNEDATKKPDDAKPAGESPKKAG